MGIIFSRFKKKKTAQQQLENLEKDIMSIEEYLKMTELEERRTIGNLVLYSVLVYLMVAILYYMCFISSSFKENVIYVIPLVIYPVVILLLKRLMGWYYKRKMESNEGKLLELKSSKKKILEEVMDTETYKTAKDILEKYAPEQLNKGVSNSKTLMKFLPAVNHSSSSNISEGSRSAIQKSAVALRRETTQSMDDPTYSIIPNISFQAQSSQPKFPLFRPVLPRERGPVDKLVDMLIGDGPNNRYALICKTCSSHNGMALKHEFEYLSFRCAYCLQFNPARKQKPRGPTLSRDREPDTRFDEFDSFADSDGGSFSRKSEDADGSSPDMRFEQNNGSSVNAEQSENTEDGSEIQNETSGEDIDMRSIRNAVEEIELAEDPSFFDKINPLEAEVSSEKASDAECTVKKEIRCHVKTDNASEDKEGIEPSREAVSA